MIRNTDTVIKKSLRALKKRENIFTWGDVSRVVTKELKCNHGIACWQTLKCCIVSIETHKSQYIIFSLFFSDFCFYFLFQNLRVGHFCFYFN